MGYFSDLRNQVQLPLLVDPLDGTSGLRRAQLGAITAIQSHHTLSTDEPGLIVMPTGSGKTGVMMTVPFLLDATRVLIVTPSRIVRYQIAEDFRRLDTLTKIGILPKSVEAPRIVEVHRRRRTLEQWEALRDFDVVISTPASVSPAFKDIVAPPEGLFDLILVDEAHHSPAFTWQALLSAFPGAKRLLFTATPFRRDEQVIEGNFLYAFPVADAYADGIFSHIDYVPVTESPDQPLTRDLRIAREAERVLKQDQDAGFSHSLMVRTDTKARAEALMEVYTEHTALKLEVIHSGLTFNDVTNRTGQLRTGAIDGVICVDMLGEGYDLPNLKIAAIHAPHKSLAVLLQYIGRFSRPGDGQLGSAKFIAVPSDISIASVELYSQSAAWQEIIPGLIDAGVAEEVERKRVLNSFTQWEHEDEGTLPEDVSLFGLRPYFHIRAYRVTPPIDLDAILDLGRNRRIAYRWTSATQSATVFIVETIVSPRWTNMSVFPSKDYTLFIVYLSADGQYLFVNASERERGNDSLYLLIVEQLSPNGFAAVDQESAKRCLSGLVGLTNFMVGMRNHQYASGIETYRTLTGPSANRAILPIDGESYLLGHSYGKGLESGQEVTIGWSGSGKVWSNRTDSIPELIKWCEALAQRFAADGPVVTNSEIDLLRIGNRVAQFPGGAISSEWPHDFFTRTGVIKYEASKGSDRECDMLDLAINLDRSCCSVDEIRFRVSGAELDAVYSARLDRQPFIQPENEQAANVQLVRSRNNIPLWRYFFTHPPAFFFSDFSYVIGNAMFPTPAAEISHFPSEQIEAIDWEEQGVLITWEYGECGPLISVHDYLERRLREEHCDLIFFDHLAPEAADFIAMKEFADRVELRLYHCKGSSSREAGTRTEDLIEVVGQAGKSVRWLHNLPALRRKIEKRFEARPERFKWGDLTVFDQLLSATRMKPLLLVVVAVQPGLSLAHMDGPVSALLGATDAYLVRARCLHLRVIASA
jgi:superfamily II DNA or RNA helicase